MPYLCEPTYDIVDAAHREIFALNGTEASHMLGEEARSDVACQFWANRNEEKSW
jgi:hypothetical protein